MNWLVFFLGAWVVMGLELGLRDGLALGPTGAAPSFAMIYLVFIALSSPRRTAVWAGLVVGVMLDLTRAMPAADGLTIVKSIGPMAVGGALAAYTATIVRSSLYHRNPVAAPIVVALSTFLAHLVALALLTVRTWYDPAVELSAVRELGRISLIAVFTAVVAFVLGIILRPILPALASVFMFDVTPSAWRWGPPRRHTGLR